jgi:predicted helicase
MNFQYYLAELNNNLDLGSERSHYYALKSLIDNAVMGINAIIEEKGNQAGIPDFTVRKNDNLIGYIEAKKLGEDLNKIQESEQLKRYFDSAIGQNLILTNFLEFRLFRDGKLYLYATLGSFKNNKITLNKDNTKTGDLINSFLNYQPKTINNYLELAQQMAVYTKSVKYAIEEALKIESETGELTKLKAVFTDLLLPDLDNHNFADMYAQTIAYGLFTARFYQEKAGDRSPLTPLKKGGNNDVNLSLEKGENDEINSSLKKGENNNLNSPLTKGGRGGSKFNRQTASNYISDKIPFLQGLFKTVIQTDIITQIDWAIDNLIELFAKVDMGNLLENFSQETNREDPVVHFYETFLGAYEADLRKSRGVYYTPESVVNFIVKAVNSILEKDFNLPNGLANNKVIILDPATGTGIFLDQVISQIYDNFAQNNNDQKKYTWNEYLKQTKLLERLFGYELLITPYTIAHLKLKLLLDNLGYKFQADEKLNIFLINVLDEIIEHSDILSEKYISETINPNNYLLVVLGNPPYSGHSANKNSWIDLGDYYMVDGVKLDEKNPKWLQDDYVKFIRFGQWKIEQIQEGVLAFITNHGYLDNPTFRGMRQNLMQSFERIFIINLHGNVKKKEASPDGSKDENVFDIQQGVSILIALKSSNFTQENLPDIKPFSKEIYYYDLWGKREEKYKFLEENEFHQIKWQEINPVSPFYLFTPQDDLLREEYHNYWKITDIMPVNSVGIVTARDSLTIQNSPEKVREIITDLINLSEEEVREKYNLGKDSQDWKVSLAQKDVKNYGNNQDLVIPILYRPFDLKYTYYTGKSGGFICRPRGEVMRNMLLGDNLGIAIGRSGQAIDQNEWNIVFCSNYITELNLYRRGGNNLFPLYLYPNTEDGQKTLITERETNFSSEFIKAITEKLSYTPTPENIFYYIYAILHSPEYRHRYQSFLKIDFPRIPLTSNNDIFTQLATKGEILFNLHLLKQLPEVKITQNQTVATVNLPLFNGQTRGKIHYEGDGKNEISQIKYHPDQEKITINQNCYFLGIPQEVWDFKIGGYQVLDKWLKDRKKANQHLSSEDISHYQKIIVALVETLKIMNEIDQIIVDFTNF